MDITLSNDHIAIRAVDYAGTLRWYTEKLDFHVDLEWPYGGMQLAYLSNGTAKVEVLGGATAEPQPDPISLEPTFQHEGLNHFCLTIEDFDGTLAELRARGVELVGEPFVVEEINRNLAFIKDNSGNLIELSAPRTSHKPDPVNPNTDDVARFDFVIVGAGTAGSVLAARLTEQPDVRVLLLEAGPADGPERMSVPGAWPTLIGSEVDWRYTTVPQSGLGGAAIPYPRGRVLGGSSAINAMFHLRGHRSAIDSWAAGGATGWSYDDLLPYFRRSERTHGLDPRYRGVDGPMRPERVAPDIPAARAALRALQGLGYPVSADLNGAEAEGTAWNEVTIADGVRQSAADAYLRPVLDRRNLTVVTGALAHRLVITHGRCTGVEYTHGGIVHRAEAHAEVVLCAGAIGSPQLLMVSGIGPADGLRTHDLHPLVDLPGVGANLADHPLGLVVYASPGPLPGTASGTADVVAAVRSDPALRDPNLHIFFGGIPLAPPSMQGHSGFTIGYALLAPRSRGAVTLASADPGTAPRIDPGLLNDDRDVADMLAGLRLARAVGTSPALAPWRTHEVFPGAAVETGDQLRRSGTVGTYFHPVGTCKLGIGPDAVVDLQLRVHGVDGLRVVDASVMPSLPAANTNATVLAIAERAAAIITGHDRLPDQASAVYTLVP